jgi:hypothetical protein
VHEPNHAFAHEASGTFVRIADRGSKLQLIRDGKRIFEDWHHGNNPVTMSRAGLVKFSSGSLIDVSSATPTPKSLRDAQTDIGKVIFPDGRATLEYQNGAYKHPQGLYEISLAGKRRRIWSGSTSGPLRVNPFRIGAGKPTKLPDFRYPEVALSPDGSTWLLFDHHRWVIGRGAKVTANVAWSDSEYAFFTPRLTWDLPRGRLVITGPGGITALAVDGGAVVARLAKTCCASAVLPYRGELLIAVSQDLGMKRSFDVDVQRLHPETLKPIGRFDDMPQVRVTDPECGLLALADGSVVLVPRDAPITIVGTPGPRWKAGTLVRIVKPGRAAPKREHSRASDFALMSTSEGRKELAARVVEDLADKDTFESILDKHPEAFAPHRDTILGWDADRVSLLAKLSRDFFLAAAGASDDAVRTCAAHLCDAKEKEDVDALAALLFGAATDTALGELAKIARKRNDVAQSLYDHCVEVPSRGAAQLRFAPKGDDAFLRRVRGVAIEGWGCLRPPRYLGALDSSKVAPLAKSKARHHHFFLSDCEECEEYALAIVWRARAGNVKLIDALTTAKRPPKSARCKGGGARSRAGGNAVLGGPPHWTQHAEVPSCSVCGRLMFYVGEVRDVDGRDLFGFQCEDCGVGTQIVQFT